MSTSPDDVTVRELLDEAGFPVASAESPERLGRYPVTGHLGRGGMGEVLQVRDEEVGRELAAKVMLEQADRKLLTKFVREAQITGQLEHPNIVPMYELGRTDDGRFYYTMKRIEGRDLEGLLSAEPPSLLEALQIYLKVCDAMAFAHSRGVIHRDLKPANVLVGRFGEVHVCDWGLARIAGKPDTAAGGCALDLGGGDVAERARAGSDAALTTVDGAVVGTPAYMPPEQARGEVERLDRRSDVYALGAILYRILAGTPPYEGASVWNVLHELLNGELVPLSERAPDRQIPWELEAVVLKAMDPRPVQRYDSVAALRADVESWLAGSMLRAADYRPWQRLAKWARRHRGALALVAVAVVPLVAGLGWTRWRAHRERARQLAELERSARAELEGLPTAGALRGRWEARIERLRAGELLPPETPEALAERQRMVRSLLRVGRLLDRASRIEPLPALHRRAVESLGWAALLGGDRTLAAHAFGQLGEDGAALLQTVERDRNVQQAWREQRVQAILADVRAGLERKDRPPGAPRREEYLFELVSYRDPRTVERLDEALQAVKETEVALGQFLCEALGRLRLAQAVAPLARFLARVKETRLQVAAGQALCNTRRPEAFEPLVGLMNSLGSDSGVWRRVQPWFRRVPEPARMGGDRKPDAKWYYRRGVFRAERSDYRGAVADFNTAIHLAPRVAGLHVDRGRAREALGDLAGARADLDHAIRLNPRSWRAYCRRGYVRMRQGDLQGAMTDFDSVIDLAPEKRAGYYGRASVLIEARNWPAARQIVDRLVREHPSWAEVRELRGVMRSRNGDPAGAVVDLSVAIQLNSGRASVYTNRAAARFKLGDLAGALTDCTKAIELDPHYAPAWSNRGSVYLELGKLRRAERDVTRATELAPDRAAAFITRASIKQKGGDLGGAAEDYRRAMRAEPRSWKPLVGLAQVERARGNLSQALEWCSRALKVSPGLAVAYYTRGQIRSVQGKTASAIEDFTKAISADVRLTLAYLGRGRARERLGEHHSALADGRCAAELEPRNWQAWSLCGDALANSDRRDQALRAYRRALDLAPPDRKPKIQAAIKKLEATLKKQRR